jgi:hypothetical protein
MFWQSAWGSAALEKSMHSSRAAFSSLQTQHGYGRESDDVVRELLWSVVSGTFAFAAASPLGLRSAARLLVPVVVDDSGDRLESGRHDWHNVEGPYAETCWQIRVVEETESGLRLEMFKDLMMPFVVRRRQLSAASERHRSRVMGGSGRNGAPRPRSSEPRPINT